MEFKTSTIMKLHIESGKCSMSKTHSESSKPEADIEWCVRYLVFFVVHILMIDFVFFYENLTGVYIFWKFDPAKGEGEGIK